MSEPGHYRAELPDGTRIERAYRKEGAKRVPRGNWQWVVYDPDRAPKRKRVNLRTKDKGAAMKTALDHARARSLGTFDPWTDNATEASSPMLTAAIARYLTERLHSVSPATVETDRGYLKRLEHELPAGSLVRHVDRGHVASVVNARKRPKTGKDGKRRGPGPEASGETKRRRRASLQRFFAWAVEQGMCRANLAEAVDVPKARRGRRDHVTEAEADAILRAAAAADVLSGGRGWLSEWVRFGLGTGLRPSEQAQLRWSAVYLDERAVDVGKGHRVKTAASRRRVPVRGDALTVLRHLAAERTSEADGLVFSGEKGGAVNLNYLSKRLQKLATRAKVGKDVSAYSLRHAYGTKMAAAGVPLTDLARLMGTSVRMLETHYAHFDPARGASHVDRVFGEEEPKPFGAEAGG